MGTHPSGPAKVADGHLLSEKLKENPEIVGFVPEDYVANDLPFLFKVLSIQTALSIQAHPDKARAIRLHSKFPDIYKDPNHKPEMVIALGDFECLSGFRTKSEILELAQQYPEFGHLLTAAGTVRFARNLCKLFRFLPPTLFIYVGFSLSEGASLSDEDFIKQASVAYLNCNHEIVTANLRPMIHRLREKKSTDLEQLLIRLYDQYPDDIGVFAPLLLNYLKMQQGESFFIGPNVPHAYISGDCVECMALSDNVVRAGLTPKLRDVETLCEMLTYSSGKPAFIDTVAIDGNTRLYRPPKTDCAEFEVEEIRLTEPSSVTLRALPAASLVLVLSAPSPIRAVSTADDSGLTTELSLSMGSVFFLASNAQVDITASSSGEYLLYRAHVNLA